MAIACPGCVTASTLAGLAMAAATTVEPADLEQVAETEDGFVFFMDRASLREHPLGHAITVRARGAPRPLQRDHPTGAQFVSIESRWVLDCWQGTFSNVLDRFYDAQGVQVAEFAASPHAQQAPARGSVSWSVLRGICAFIGHPRAR